MITKTGAPKKPRNRPKRKRRWRLATNHQNMLYMLAAGMVMGPSGFRGKHYSDPLSVYPGWIPLFYDSVGIPADALSHATSERKHLLPCIASLDFDLDDLSVPVQTLSWDGKRRKVIKSKRKDDIALLIRAPLPTSWLSSISFQSVEDEQAFERAANDVSNVDLFPYRVEVAESLFSSVAEVTWPPHHSDAQLVKDEDGGDTIPAFGLALGGVLAMLYHTAGRSDLALAAFRSATGDAFGRDDDLVENEPILCELPNWMARGEISEQADTRARLFWGVVELLVDAQRQEHWQTPIDVALAYLEQQRDQLQDTKFHPQLERLITDMRGCLGLGGGTITELLERHKGPLSRSLLLFCLREHCTDLMEFSHSLLTDVDYVLAAILFGVRDAWLQIPKALRNPVLSRYVAFWMADSEHCKQKDKHIMDVPPRPKPLRELFTLPGGEWSDDRMAAAVELARKCHWSDCFRTCITLEEGDLPESLSLGRKGRQLVLPGRVKAVEEKVDETSFLRKLGQCLLIDPEIESEVRKKIGSLQGIGE